MIADLRQQIAAMKQRTAPMGTGLGTFVGTQYQQNQTWNRQVGFPAELTSTFDPVTGYSWKALARDLAAPELTDPTPQNIGDNAIAVDGDETLTVGTRVWLEPDPMGVGYEFQVGGGGGDVLGCSAFASLEATSCLQLTVRGTPAGRCVEVDPDQTILLEDDDEDGVWTGTTQFVTDTDSWDVSWEWPAGECCSKLTFDNGTAVSLRYMGCGNGKLVFIGYGTDLCGQPVDTGPCVDNSFAVELECVLCPNPDYAGPGWYCVAVTGCAGERSCQEFTSDPGISVILCLGPYETESECAGNCIVDTIAPCVGGIEYPTTLYIRWPDDFIYDGFNSNYVACDPEVAALAGTTATTITYNVGTGYWEGTQALGCGDVDFELRPTCSGSTVTSWRLEVSGGIDSADPAGDLLAILSADPLHLRWGNGGNLINPGTCCGALAGGATPDRNFQIFE
jgi:hypothetical protein